MLTISCSTTTLTPGGASIEVLRFLDRKDCKNLGPVFATSMGLDYVESSSNSLRNKASLKGATHLEILPHPGDGTQQGIAYSCPR